MSQLAEFLRRVLPAPVDGALYVSSNTPALGAGPSVSHAMSQPEQLAAGKNHGFGAYFSLAQFNAGVMVVVDVDGTRRVSRADAYVTARRAFVLDIDVRPEKNTGDLSTHRYYNTKGEAAAALQVAIKAGDLPMPAYMVDTGRGWQVYWLGRDYNPDEWRMIDRAFTAHLAAVLPARAVSDITTSKRLSGLHRLPESLNYATTPATPTALFALDAENTCAAWLESLPARYPHAQTPQGSPQGAPQGTTNTLSAPLPPLALGPIPTHVLMRSTGCVNPVALFGRTSVQKDRDYSAAVQHCSQLRWALGNPDAVDYSAWFEVGRVCTFLPDGFEIMQDYQSRYSGEVKAGYDIADKWPQMRAAGADSPNPGALCSTLSDMLGDTQRHRCVGCKFYRSNGGSPISAMEFAETQAQASRTPMVPGTMLTIDDSEYLRVPTRLSPGTVDTDVNNVTPYPRYFIENNGKLVVLAPPPKTTKKDSGVTVDSKMLRVEVCSPAFWCVSWASMPTSDNRERLLGTTWACVSSSNGQCLTVDFGDGPEIVGRAVEMPKSVGTTAADVRKFLIEEWSIAAPEIMDGFKGTLLRGYIANERAYARDNQLLTVPPHGCWSDDETVFRFGDTNVSAAGLTRIVTSKNQNSKELGVSGSMAEQIRVLRYYEDPEASDVARFLILQAMASPLLRTRRGSTPEGLSYVSVRESASGVGKSAMQYVCTSLAGRPSAVGISGNDTLISMSLSAGTYGSVYAPVDEVTSLEGWAEMLRMVTQGRDRRRGMPGKEGVVLQESLATWSHVRDVSCNLNFMGELFADARADVQSFSAAMFRCLLIRIEESMVPATPKWTALTTEINHVLSKNYGWMVAAITHWYINNKVEFHNRVDAAYAALMEEFMPVSMALTGGGNADRFIAEGLAVVTVVGEVIEECGYMATSMWSRFGVDTVKKTREDMLEYFGDRDNQTDPRVDAPLGVMGDMLQPEAVYAHACATDAGSIMRVVDGLVQFSPFAGNTGRTAIVIEITNGNATMLVTDSFAKRIANAIGAPQETLTNAWSRVPGASRPAVYAHPSQAIRLRGTRIPMSMSVVGAPVVETDPPAEAVHQPNNSGLGVVAASNDIFKGGDA